MLKKRMWSFVLCLLLLVGALPICHVAAATIPNGLKYEIIGSDVHIKGYGYTSPGDLVIPDTIYNYPVKYVNSNAFSDLSSLRSVTLPNGVEMVGDGAFYNCTTLQVVSLGNSISEISNYTFTGCASLIALYMPASVIYIGYDAFSFCDNLTDIYFGGTEEDRANMMVMSGNEWLDNATWHYNSEPALPPTVKPVETNGLIYENQNGRITITGYTADLPAEVVIPAILEDYEVSAIKEEAFVGAYGLYSITIPNSVTYIGERAFKNTNLTHVYYDGTAQDAAYIFIGVDNERLENAVWHYASTPDDLNGDVNGDGKVNNRDLGMLQQYLNEWDVTVSAFSDLNGDGKINNRDLGLLQQLLNA